MANDHLTATRFSELGLSDSILANIKKVGFEFCTPIQAETIPQAMQGKNIAGQAQTGTGKSAAFIISMLHHLEQHPASNNRSPNQPRSIIIAPTRELAVQIYKDTLILASNTKYKIKVVYGGANYNAQKNALTDVDILIGTPGRLIDYYKQRIYNLKQIQVVVLDEADRMFDLGFIRDVRFLLRRMPPPDKRLGLLFSATLGFRVNELAYEHMNNPKMIIAASEHITADRIKQQGYMVANDEKIPLLIGLLNAFNDNSRSIVFVNTKDAAQEVWGYLEGNGIKSAILSGDIPQKERLSLLNRFQNNDVQVLVATDVAARGLHIPDVTHVINYDLPQDSEDYVHRIGRTARAGNDGEAISFVCETWAMTLPAIEDFIEVKIPMQIAPKELLAQIDSTSRVYRKKKRVPHRRGNHTKPHLKKHQKRKING